MASPKRAPRKPPAPAREERAPVTHWTLYRGALAAVDAAIEQSAEQCDAQILVVPTRRRRDTFERALRARGARYAGEGAWGAARWCVLVVVRGAS